MSASKNRPSVTQFLQERQAKFPNLVEWWSSFEENYNKKLWHQLTMKISAFVHLPNANKTDFVSLYKNFIIDFETKINPLTLVEIISIISREIQDYEERLEFVESIKKKVKANQDAQILCSIFIGQFKLAKRDSTGAQAADLKGVKAVLEEIGPVIDEETGVTTVHGRYFQLSSDYHQLMGHHGEYYRNALRFLGCTDVKDEPTAELQKRAFALALSALLGESIFNFGELLQHPILQHLHTIKPWLVELLFAFNCGDIEKFEQLKPQWVTQADLASHEIQLRQKISLLCLMEMTFKSSSGILKFAEIANKARLPVNEVELLVMKALSLQLVKGNIDEVDKSVTLCWVQPRVLDKTQIRSLGTKLENWCRGVNKMEKLVEQKAQDIIG